MKFHGVEMQGNFICLTVSSLGLLGSAGIKGRVAYVESENSLYVDTGTEWRNAGIDPKVFDSNSILAANLDNTPISVSAGEQTVFGRLTGGNIKALSTTELTTLVEKATSAEALSGSINTKFITPLTLSSLFSTGAQTSAGSASNLIVTPESLNGRVASVTDIIAGTDNLKFATSQSISGSRATGSETISGSIDNKFITPAALTSKIDTDGTLAANSNLKIPSQAAVKTYVSTFSRGGTIVNNIDYLSSQNVIVWYATKNCTVTAVKGYRVGGTGATINARKNGTSNHLASAKSLTSADTWMDGGAVQNTTYVAGDKLEIMLVSVTGNVTQIGIQVDFVRT